MPRLISHTVTLDYSTKLKFWPKDEGRSGYRPLLHKTKFKSLEDLTLERSYHSVIIFCVLWKLGAVRPHFRPHWKCSVIILCMPMESWSLSLFRQCQNRLAKEYSLRKRNVPSLTEICTHERPKTLRKIATTIFGELMFCLWLISHLFFFLFFNTVTGSTISEIDQMIQ